MPEICRFYGIVIKMYFADLTHCRSERRGRHNPQMEPTRQRSWAIVSPGRAAHLDITPDRERTSASHRPSSSRSISIVNVTWAMYYSGRLSNKAGKDA